MKIINKINKYKKLHEIQNIAINRGLEGGKNNLKKHGKYQILIPDNIERYITFDSNQFVDEYHDSFKKDRILIIRIRSLKISRRIIASYENQNRATLKTLQQIYFDGQSDFSLKCILGIINSNLINFYCSHYLIDDINKKYIEQLPIPNSQLPNPTHDRIVSIVSQMLEAQKQYHNFLTTNPETQTTRLCVLASLRLKNA